MTRRELYANYSVKSTLLERRTASEIGSNTFEAFEDFIGLSGFAGRNQSARLSDNGFQGAHRAIPALCEVVVSFLCCSDVNH